MAARVTTPRGEVALETPLVGRGNLANLLAATAVAVGFDVPLEAIADRARRLAPASHRGEVVRLGRGVVVVDDSYNANPTATRTALEVMAGAGGAARRVAVLGEMLELGDESVRLHEEVGRAAAERIDLLLDGRRRAGARPGGRGDRLGAGARPGPLFRHERRGRRGGGAPARAGRPRARQGLARRADRPRRGSDPGGVRLMLLRLLYPFHTEFSVLNVTRYITFRTAAASLSALAISLALGPWLVRKLREFQIGQVIRQEGPGEPPPEGRHADHGRAADSDGGARADAAVGGPDERLRLDRGADDGGLRRDRLRGRLPEDRPPIAPRAAAALQDDLPGADRDGGRRHAARAGARRAVQHAARLPVLQAADSRPRLGVSAVRGVRARRRVERGEPDRRPRRARDQHLRDRRGRLHRARLRHRPPRLRGVPAARALSAGGGADRLLRIAGRRVARLPLVQLRTPPKSSWATSGRWRSAPRWAPSRS